MLKASPGAATVVAILGLLPLVGCGDEPAAAIDGVPFAVTVPYAQQDDETRLRIARMEGYFPNHELTTHDGRTVRFYDDLLRGKTVLINFMYTDCDGI